MRLDIHRKKKDKQKKRRGSDGIDRQKTGEAMREKGAPLPPQNCKGNGNKVELLHSGYRGTSSVQGGVF